ncbi:hypothetical protein EUX98_g3580 [Antrodiella citrinella]|uniref:Uncharacterized protein n=1 Tax=Antrodiella citrinella TaxID=2447956 RepID=A0A4S4MW80_9APHY|nr:hypothetical protein EUX98_g3580 [Antrodiella citrinella]
MYYNTPSPTQPTTPPAPYPYTNNLPPSPVTPSNRHLGGDPRAPQVRSVGLPYGTPHGLMTPPSSPERNRTNMPTTLARELTRGYAHTMPPFLLFQAPVFNRLYAQPATSPESSTIYVHIGRHAFAISGANGVVTLWDVVQRLATEWVRYRRQDDERGSTRYTAEGNLVGDIYASRGFYFDGLTPSIAGPSHYDLHLRF